MCDVVVVVVGVGGRVVEVCCQLWEAEVGGFFFLGFSFLVVVGLVWFGLFCFALKLKEWFFCLGEDSCIFHLAFLELRDDGVCLGIICLKCEYASHLLQM